MSETAVLHFAVGNVPAHDGYVTHRNAADIWTGENPGGWTYQQVCEGTGTILYEGDSETEAQETLDAWLECDAAERGAYCYTHNPRKDR